MSKQGYKTKQDNKTEKHDKIHLWLHSKENQIKISQNVIPRPKKYENKFSKRELEQVKVYIHDGNKDKGSNQTAIILPKPHRFEDYLANNSASIRIDEAHIKSFVDFSKRNHSKLWNEGFNWIDKENKDALNNINLKDNNGLPSVDDASLKLLTEWVYGFKKKVDMDNKFQWTTLINWWWRECYLKPGLKATYIIERILNVDVGNIDYNVSKITREIPMYSGYNKSYLSNVIDCIMVVETTTWGELNLDIFSSSDWRWDDYDKYTNKYTILCEFKPVLSSISALMGQIHIYMDHLKTIREYYETTIIPIVVTFDKNEEYDDLLNSDGIKIYRITEEKKPITDSNNTPIIEPNP